MAVSYMDHDPAFFRSAFKFCFVRNPWDRFHSAFHFLKHGTAWPIQQKWARANIGDLDFEEFTLRLSSRWRGSFIKAERFFWPQTEWTKIGGDNFALDRFYRFEELEESLDDLCMRLDLVRPAAVPRLRVQKKKVPYHEVYTPRMVDLVGSLYESDVREFGYDFLPESR